MVTEIGPFTLKIYLRFSFLFVKFTNIILMMRKPQSLQIYILLFKQFLLTLWHYAGSGLGSRLVDILPVTLFCRVRCLLRLVGRSLLTNTLRNVAIDLRCLFNLIQVLLLNIRYQLISTFLIQCTLTVLSAAWAIFNGRLGSGWAFGYHKGVIGFFLVLLVLFRCFNNLEFRNRYVVLMFLIRGLRICISHRKFVLIVLFAISAN